ncbi:hypothetical protein Tco_0810734 [Tanacetum coccineum]
MSAGITDEHKGLAADAPTSSNTSKITLIRNSDGYFDVKKNDKSDAAKKETYFDYFYERKVKIYYPFSEEEEDLVDYIWSDSCPKGDIVFSGKGLQLECVWFLSLHPEIQVFSNIIDVWTTILNNEDKFRDKSTFSNNLYCTTHILYGQIDILDNIYNDDEDIIARYGIYAMALIDSHGRQPTMVSIVEYS